MMRLLLERLKGAGPWDGWWEDRKFISRESTSWTDSHTERL